MPLEDELRGKLDSTLQFDSMLRQLFNAEFSGDVLDRLAIPSDSSLVGDDGAFHLFRLARSSLIQTIRASVKSMFDVTGNVIPHAPGIAACQWLCQMCEWIDSVQTSVVPKLAVAGTEEHCIPLEVATHLVASGERFVLAADDIRRDLSEYDVRLSTSTDGECVVIATQPGVELSLGFTSVRWCLFLLKALQSDVARHADWKSQWSAQRATYLSVTANKAEFQQPSAATLQRFYELREDIACLLASGLDLFVSPSATDLEEARNLVEFFGRYLPSLPTADAAKAFTKSRYTSSDMVVMNRFELLDSLVDRGPVLEESLPTFLDEDSKKGHFRVAARMLLVNAFRKGVRALHLDDESERGFALCAAKAWAIENSLFDLYQVYLGESKISSEYQSKARALRRSLEDPGNLSLFISVLCGKVSADDLVRMSVEELANPTVQRDRKMAADAAKESYVLTKTPLPNKDSSLLSETTPASVPSPGSERVNQQKSPASILTSTLSEISIAAPTVKSPNNDEVLGRSNSSTAGSTSTLRQSTKFGDLIKTARGSGPPPPPPSLVMSMKSTSRDSTKAADNANGITNSSGDDRFYFSVGEGKFSFFVTLHVERDVQNDANGLLQSKWTQKGRVKGDIMNDFFKGKMKGGRREVVILRVATVTDKDAREHKKFCKEYEGNVKRVAMFELDDDEKAYFVTPRFHRDAGGLTFARPTSTYVVLFAKKRNA
jgi:Transcription factor S-II (TFIIS), central domain